MACLGTSITIQVEAEETQLCHSGDEFHGKSPAIEVGGDERHAFFIYEFTNSVPEESLSIGQDCFDLKVIDHLRPVHNKIIKLIAVQGR
jgi:hypothetical protein